MLARMLFRLLRALLTGIYLISGFAAAILLYASALTTVSLLTHRTSFSWVNPLSWGVPLHWSWGTVWKAALVGLLIWLAIMLMENRLIVRELAEPYSKAQRQIMTGTPYAATSASRLNNLIDLSNMPRDEILQALPADFASSPTIMNWIQKNNFEPLLTPSQQRKYYQQLNKLYGMNYLMKDNRLN